MPHNCEKSAFKQIENLETNYSKHLPPFVANSVKTFAPIPLLNRKLNRECHFISLCSGPRDLSTSDRIRSVAHFDTTIQWRYLFHARLPVVRLFACSLSTSPFFSIFPRSPAVARGLVCRSWSKPSLSSSSSLWAALIYVAPSTGDATVVVLVVVRWENLKARY